MSTPETTVTAVMKIRQGRTNIWLGMVNDALTITVKKNRGKQFTIEFTPEATRALGTLVQGGGARLPIMAEVLPLPRETKPVPEGKGLHKEADGIVAGMD